MKNDIDSADRLAEKNEGVPPAVMRDAQGRLRAAPLADDPMLP